MRDSVATSRAYLAGDRFVAAPASPKAPAGCSMDELTTYLGKNGINSEERKGEAHADNTT